MEITLRKGAFMIIGVIVFLVIVLIFLGGIGKIKTIWDQMFAENIHDENGLGTGVCPAIYSYEKDQLGALFEAAKASPNNRCLMKFHRLPDLSGYEIQLESTSYGVSIGVAKKGSSPSRECTYDTTSTEGDNIIEGIYPCLLGSVVGNSYATFKQNWFYNYPTVQEGEIYDTPVTVSENNKIEGNSGGKNDIEKDLGGYYLYKTSQAGKTFLCFIKNDDKEQNDLLRKIPTCDVASGPPYGTKERYSCTIRNDGKINNNLNNDRNDEITYYFKNGEYYCEDQIKYCDGSQRKFVDINEADTVPFSTCKGDNKPYNKQDNCCCMINHADGTPGEQGSCVRFSFPSDSQKNMVSSCSVLGPNWAQQKCPEDISYRAGYYGRTGGGGGSW